MWGHIMYDALRLPMLIRIRCSARECRRCRQWLICLRTAIRSSLSSIPGVLSGVLKRIVVLLRSHLFHLPRQQVKAEERLRSPFKQSSPLLRVLPNTKQEVDLEQPVLRYH